MEKRREMLLLKMKRTSAKVRLLMLKTIWSGPKMCCG